MIVVSIDYLLDVGEVFNELWFPQEVQENQLLLD